MKPTSYAALRSMLGLVWMLYVVRPGYQKFIQDWSSMPVGIILLG